MSSFGIKTSEVRGPDVDVNRVDAKMEIKAPDVDINEIKIPLVSRSYDCGI